MNFIALFESYNWFSGTWVIHTALECWSTLVVVPSGDVLPDKWFRRVQPNELPDISAAHQSPEQKAAWENLNANFYNRIMKRANECEATFSAENLSRIRKYFKDIEADETLVSQTALPKDKAVMKIQEQHVNEQRDGLLIAEYMLHLDRESALTFLENLSISWAASLPVPENSNPFVEHGRDLYLLAEQME